MRFAHSPGDESRIVAHLSLNMLSQQATLLRQFDEGLRPEIAEFGKRIREVSGNVDVIIFMARKAACFAEALRLVRLTAFQSVVTSNRVLDMDPSWLHGKSIAIVDDALITGTELYRTIERVQPYAKSVEVHILAANRNWNAGLVKPTGRYLELDDEECALVCANIVDAIALIPMPYSTDYPFYSGCRIGVEELPVIAHLPAWQVADVTSSLQSKYSVFSKTITPEPETVAKLDALLGAPLATGALAKIRLYGRWFDTGKTTYWCNITPIIAFEALSKATVDALFQRAVTGCRLSAEAAALFKAHSSASSDIKDARYKAKLRFIQFCIAVEMTSLWKDDVNRAISRKLHLKLDLTNLGFLFPPLVASQVYSCKLSPRAFDGIHLSTEVPRQPRSLKQFEPSALPSEDAWSIENYLTAPFVRLYRELELPARKLARRYGKLIFTDPNISAKHFELINRLQGGFGLRHLRSWLSQSGLDPRLREKVVSLFLDRAIDLGAVVPITAVVGDSVFRAYRHGEDILFGEEELRLATVLLRSLYGQWTAFGRTYISQIEVEKALVLFVRIGLEKQFLRRPEKAVLGDRGTAGIRFSLHGAVLGVESSQLYTVDSGSSATGVLERAGVLKRVEPNRKWKGELPYTVSDELVSTETDIQRKATPQVKNLGRLIGELRNRARKANAAGRLSQKELILIATCTTARDTTGALAAEVRIADKFLRGLRERCDHFRFVDGTENSALELGAFMRDPDVNLVPVALHSGAWKFESFKAQLPWAIIKRVDESLSGSSALSDALLRNLWSEYWPHSLNQDPKRHALYPLICDLAGWLYAAKAYYSIIQLALSYHGDKNSPLPEEYLRAADEAYEKYAELVKPEMRSSVSPARVIGEDITEGRFVPQAACKLACARLLELLEQSSDLLRQVDVSASPYGSVKTFLRFRNVLICKAIASPSTNESVVAGVRDLICSALASYSAIHKHTHSAFLLPRGYFIQDAAAIVVGYASRELDSLTAIACVISRRFSAQADISHTLLWDLPEQFCPLCEEHSNEYFGRLFSEVCKTASTELLTRDRPSIEMIGPTSFSDCQSITPETKRQLNGTFDRMERTSSSRLTQMSPHVVLKERFIPHSNYMIRNANTACDIGILTVVGDEARAVTSYLSKRPGFRDFGDYTSDKTVRKFMLGSLPARGGGFHRIAVVQSTKQGNSAIMPAYQDLYNEFSPTLVVLIGIGGSINEDLVENDVCVANAVINYDSRAETAGGIKHTLDPLPPLEPWLMEVWSSVVRKHGESFKLMSENGLFFKVRMGPIGSGGAVIKNDLSDMRAWLSDVCRKTTAVETEAVGVTEQFSQNKLRHGHSTRGVLILRGISDKADPLKDDRFRETCIRNAMTFLEEFVSHCSVGFADVLPRQ